MAKSSWKSSWSGTYTATQNANGSVTYTNPANGNSVTINSNWSYTTSSSSWKTYSWNLWASAASSFNSTYWSTWGWTISNWTFTPNASSSSSSSWGGGWWGGSDSWTRNTTWCNYNLIWERYTDWGEVANWASPDIAWTSKPNNSTWWDKDPTWWQPQSCYSWGGWWGGGGWDKNWDCQNYPEYPQYPQQSYPDYSWQFDNIKDYINNLSWDLSWMKDLMEKNNTMFLSKLDAQMTQQKQMEERFNQERSKIEWQMDQNTREQKSRLDQMEQKYTESLTKTQEMLEEYYSSTREVLERKASSATAAAASELWAKWLNSAVIENTAEGKRLQMQKAINDQIVLNANMQQQLNNDYKDFMQQIFNNHDTLNQNQIKLLQDGLKMKQEYWQQETNLVNDYIDNVYKPMENHLDTLSKTYTEKADAAYGKERAVAEYKWMSTDWRTKAIMDRLIAMVWDGNLDMLSEQDLNLVKQIAARTDIWSTEEAIAVLLKAAKQSWNSDIVNAISSASSNWTLNINGTPSTYTKWWGSNTSSSTQNYSDDSDERLTEISTNVAKYKNTNPELFKDRNKYNQFFNYNDRSETQQDLLDYMWEKLWTLSPQEKQQNYENSFSWAKQYWIKNLNDDMSAKTNWLRVIKTNWDTMNWKVKATDTYMDELKDDIKKINSIMTKEVDRWSKDYDALAAAKASLEKEYNNAKTYKAELLTNINQLSYQDPSTRKWEAALQSTKLFWQAKTDFEWYKSLVNEIVEKNSWSSEKKLKKLNEIKTQMQKSVEWFTSNANLLWITNTTDFANRINNYKQLAGQLNKYIKMYSK